MWKKPFWSIIHWDKGFGKLALNVELAPLDDAIMFALLKYSTLKKGSLDYGCASLTQVANLYRAKYGPHPLYRHARARPNYGAPARLRVVMNHGCAAARSWDARALPRPAALVPSAMREACMTSHQQCRAVQLGPGLDQRLISAFP